MTEIPAMLLWIDAYMADTSHLTTFEHGAYFLLLMAMWRRGGTLPDNDEELARYAKLRLDQWRKMAPRIRAFFVEAEKISTLKGGLSQEQARLDIDSNKINCLSQNLITQKRLSHEYRLAQSRHTRLSKAGLAGFAAKSLKNHNPPSSDAYSLEQARLKQPNPNPYISKSLSYGLGQKRGNGSVAANEKRSASGMVWLSWDRNPEQWNAWDSAYRQLHNGLSHPVDKKGGWYFPTEWPPGHRPTKS